MRHEYVHTYIDIYIFMYIYIYIYIGLVASDVRSNKTVLSSMLNRGSRSNSWGIQRMPSEDLVWKGHLKCRNGRC
jgi:hypothetical protein